jgi:hypothetical protein
MAVDAVRYRSRGKHDRDRAAKEKREKIILGVCGIVLLALLAFEGPKTLKKLHGNPTAAPPAVAPASSGAAGSTGTTAPQAAHSLSRIAKLGAKDPFVQQLGGSTASAGGPVEAVPPAVRTSHFVAKDPFVQQLTLAAPAPSVTSPTNASPTSPSTGAAADGDYIVMLASVPLSDGRAAAEHAAAAARNGGVKNVSIVNSSSYPTLRTGFYAVYSGPYPTLGALLPALQKVRGQGYPSAYTRRLAH